MDWYWRVVLSHRLVKGRSLMMNRIVVSNLMRNWGLMMRHDRMDLSLMMRGLVGEMAIVVVIRTVLMNRMNRRVYRLV